MAETKEENINFWKKYNFYIAFFAAFAITIAAIWFRAYALVALMMLILCCSLFYDCNRMIILCSMGLFTQSIFDFWSFIVFYIVSLAIIILKKLIKKEKKLTNDLIFPFCILAIFLVMFFAVNFNKNNLSFILQVIAPIVLLIELYFLRDEINIKKICRCLIIAFAIYYITSLIVYFLHISSVRIFDIDSIGIKRFKAFLGHENMLALWSSVLLSICVMLKINKKFGLLEFLIYAIILGVVGISTKSKAFLLVAFILMIVYLVVELKQNWKSGLIQIVCLLSIVGIVFLIFTDKALQYIERFTAYSQDIGIINMLTTGRVKIWNEYLQLWAENPLTVIFGKGATFFAGITKGPHSAFVECLTKYGLVGLCLLITLIIYMLTNINRKLKISYFIPAITVFSLMFIEVMSQDRSILVMLAILSIYFMANKQEQIKDIKKD